MHMRKERFPSSRKPKLYLTGDGPFQVNVRINGNAYRVDLRDESNISATINVVDISLFEIDVDLSDSRMNHVEEGE